MTEYEILLDRLFSIHEKGNFEDMKQLSEALGKPYQSYPTIHVAGTNGKGSVTHKIAKILELSGYKVGLFSSPHLFRFTERIKLNGIEISKEEMVKELNQLFSLYRELKITPKFFELTALLAFNYFAKEKVDVAVIEVGLGGRLDSTNVITPILSIITSIGLDHQAILGSTHEQIAKEKGGIIKEGVPVILGPHAVEPILKEIAEGRRAPIYQVEFSHGSFEEENQAITQKALLLLEKQFKITSEALSKGIESRPSCRFELVSVDPPIIFDVAHNESGFRRLLEDVKTKFPEKPISLFFSMSKDKDLRSLIPLFKKNVEKVFLFPCTYPRLNSPEIIGSIFEKEGFNSWKIYSSHFSALQSALKRKGVILVAGSFFIMEEILNSLQLLMPQLR